jgi:hypothetical protein
MEDAAEGEGVGAEAGEGEDGWQAVEAATQGVSLPPAGADGFRSAAVQDAVAEALRGAEEDEDDDDDDFVDDKAKGQSGLDQERKVPMLFKKAQWAVLPDMLATQHRFECRVDCESVAMALAESKRMRLKVFKRTDSYLRFGCAGCEQFKIRFAVEDRGETIGPDGEPCCGTCLVFSYYRLSHHLTSCAS